MADVGKKTKKAVRDIAGDSFEKLKNEPSEIGRSAVEQVSGTRSTHEIKEPQVKEAEISKKVEAQSKRLLEANRKELEDIRKNNKIEEVLDKIKKGQDINISSIEGLSEDQKEYLRQQKENVLVSAQKENEKRGPQGLVEPTTKQKRGVFGAMKRKVDQMKTRIETRFKSMG